MTQKKTRKVYKRNRTLENLDNVNVYEIQGIGLKQSDTQVIIGH